MLPGTPNTFRFLPNRLLEHAHFYPGATRFWALAGAALGLGPGILGSQMRIDYDVPVTVNFCSRTGTVGGSHDGYPSHMVFVKGNKVYDFNQTTTTVGPINFGILRLLPPMDVSPGVSFFW